ncbi:MAG TPA: cytochrome c peroxidase [Chthoniobacterales bacterium]|nr:cytochrome c peroxidase [Chthoniobacterales bacterium]
MAGPAALRAEDGVIDLAALPNYARQAKPAGVFTDNTPHTNPSLGVVGNPITDTGATLGRLLFYDKRLSRNNTVSCSSCHQQAHAFSDPAVASTGVGGMTARHAMRLINARFSEPRFFWDDRAPTLEALVTQPIRSAIEMGFSGTNGDPDFADLIAKLSALPEYQLLFSAAFGSPGIDEPRIQRALSQFVRSIQSFDSKFDVGNALPQPFSNFTDSEKRGRQLFTNPDSNGGANCSFCHFPVEFFNSSSSGNNGVITAIGGGTDLTVISSPTLRNLVNPNGQLNGPLMHNGSFASLAQVINHYAAIPGDNPNLSLFLKRTGVPQTLNLTQQDRADLEAFLLTLSGQAVYTDPKWSNPFRPDGSITINDTRLPGSQTVNLSTRLRVLGGDKVGIGGFIITGTVPKRVLVRALGPSLAQFNLSNLLSDPMLTLNGPAGFAAIVNDNWTSSQKDEIAATGLAPGDGLEPAIMATLPPGNYTAVLSGTNGGTGLGVLEVYDLDFAADSRLANISTRAFVGIGDDIVIAGFTVGNASGADNIVVRGLGPSLGSVGGQLLLDPALDVRNANGTSLAANDNWAQNPLSNEIIDAGLGPPSTSESVVSLTLGPGAYTALLSPAPARLSPAGVGLVEVYSRGRLP